MEEDYISLRGPIEREDEQLVMRIPLDAGGDLLYLVAKGISRLDGPDLVVTIPFWLAQKIEIREGSEVYVDNRGGKFNITKAEVQ